MPNIQSTRGFRRTSGLLACWLLLFAAASANAAHVAVQLKDGRTVRGEIDRRTDEQRLWLHSAEPSILIRSSFAWDDVLSGDCEGKRLTAAELRPLAMKLGKDAEIEPFSQIVPQQALPDFALAPQPPPPPLPLSPQELRVASVHVDAAAANWDSDPEDDGLLVYVYPLTADGRMMPVDGQLNLELYGRSTEPALYKPHFPELTRGSLRVRAGDFGPDGAVYKFPFRNFQPEQNLDIDVFGLLHARLVVAGQGTFDASDDNVRLRRLSRYRDRLQFGTGRRYLPAENSRWRP